MYMRGAKVYESKDCNCETQKKVSTINLQTVRESNIRKQNFLTDGRTVNIHFIKLTATLLVPRILVNYIVWNVIQDEVSFLSKPYRDARTKYRERVLGSKGQKKRWKTCVTFTNELLGDILGSAYVEHHFSNESKKMVRDNCERYAENKVHLSIASLMSPGKQ